MKAISFFQTQVEGVTVTFLRIANYYAWNAEIKGETYGDWITNTNKEITYEISKECFEVLADQCGDTLQSLLRPDLAGDKSVMQRIEIGRRFSDTLRNAVNVEYEKYK